MKRIYSATAVLMAMAAAVLILFFNILCYAAEVEIILEANGEIVSVDAYLLEYPEYGPPKLSGPADLGCIEISAERNQIVLWVIVKQDLESAIKTLQVLTGAKTEGDMP